MPISQPERGLGTKAKREWRSTVAFAAGAPPPDQRHSRLPLPNTIGGGSSRRNPCSVGRGSGSWITPIGARKLGVGVCDHELGWAAMTLGDVKEANAHFTCALDGVEPGAILRAILRAIVLAGAAVAAAASGEVSRAARSLPRVPRPPGRVPWHRCQGREGCLRDGLSQPARADRPLRRHPAIPAGCRPAAHVPAPSNPDLPGRRQTDLAADPSERRRSLWCPSAARCPGGSDAIVGLSFLIRLPPGRCSRRPCLRGAGRRA